MLACRWRSCGREFTEKRYLVDHVTSCHIEQRKGCDDFPCYWEVGLVKVTLKLNMMNVIHYTIVHQVHHMNNL